MQQNFLSPISFVFTIDRLPNVSFFVQSATVPGLSLSPSVVPTPFKSIKYAGDKLEHEPFTITIRVDEYMEAYNEIYNWMVKITKNESFDQYAELVNGDFGVYSDASLLIMNSKGKAALNVKFKNVFPMSLGAIQLNTTENDVNYVTCDITFEHNGHTVKKL